MAFSSLPAEQAGGTAITLHEGLNTHDGKEGNSCGH